MISVTHLVFGQVAVKSRPNRFGAQCAVGSRARGCRLPPLVRLGLQTQVLHQAHDPLASTTHTARLQSGMNAWTAIHLMVLQEKRLDFRSKLRIFSRVRADGPPAPGVIATHRHLEHLAHPRDRILVLMLGHKLILHPWLREKMLIAFFRISRS